MYWKNAMIATSDSSMPYSRMLFFRKPPYERTGVSAIFGTIFSSMMLMMLGAWHARMPLSRDGATCRSRQSLLDDGPHDLLLRRLGRRELADEAALVHDVDAVAHAQQFGHLGG